MSTAATTPAKRPAPVSASRRRRSIVLVFACTILGTLAQLLMKTGMENFKPELLALATNVPLIAGYALYGVNVIMLVLALRGGELSVLYPIIALTYVWVTLAAYFHLHEMPNLYKNIGVASIIAGVIIIGRSGTK